MARRRKTADEAIEDAGEHLNGGGSEEQRPAHNSAARAEIIRETCETVEELDRQIEGIKAERKAVVETRIVAGLGMKTKNFNAAYKLFQMDQGERDELQDTIRECFAALGVGQQINWLDAAEGVSGAA